VSDRTLLDVRDVVKTFRSDDGQVRAVDGVSLSIPRGQTFGLVGESGSGKSTLARCVLRLQQPDSGSVWFDGQDLAALSLHQMRRLRSRIQVVFQDPHGSLNRRLPIAKIVATPLVAHGVGSRVERAARVRELLELVQLPTRVCDRRPGELSGGQAQRVAIARALALRPDFVVLDEAVSALDVSVRAQVLNLLTDLQTELSLTYLFISHDLAVVRYVAQRVGVMYRGRIVEVAGRDELFETPRHPYTRLLLDGVPIVDPERQRARMRAAADGVDPVDAVESCGCRFRPRCAVGHVRDDCADDDPQLRLLDGAGALVACHHPGEKA
jgi:oligopeptide/dipeptide ABC transporter ATP-binding protein